MVNEQQTAQKVLYTCLISASFASFFLFGFSDVLKGSAVPEIISSYGISYEVGGALLGFTYLGFFFGTLVTVYLLKSISAPFLVALSAVLTCMGLVFFGFAETLPTLFTATFLTGAGCGMIDVSAILTVRLISRRDQIGRKLNQLSFFHGFGAITSPAFAGLLLTWFYHWQSIYRGAAAVALLLTFWIVGAVRKSSYQKPPEEASYERIQWSAKVLLLGGILFFYMALETGIAGWVAVYSRDVIKLSDSVSLMYLSLFFILLTVGRIVSSFYADRVGLLRTVQWNLAAILTCTVLGTFFSDLHIFFPITGFFMATIFPTTTALLVNALGNSNIRVTGLFFAIAGLGGIAGPWSIGVFSRGTSLSLGISLLVLFAAAAGLLSILFQVLSAKETK